MSKILTPLELKVMKILWRLERGFVKDILEKWDAPNKPAYNTISTIVRILKEKSFVDYEAYGRTHQYFPIISKKEYQAAFIKNAISQVFSGSTNQMFSTILSNEDLEDNDLNELKDLIDKL